jgi:L-fucose mutarotase/ribose pyranase (RbsD/FucU family)
MEDMMSEETRTETTEEVDEFEVGKDVPEIPENIEGWEMKEVIEDMIASGRSSEYAKNEYYFEFKARGQLVRGLTAPAYAFLALTEGISIESMEVTGLKTGYEADAVAIKIDTQQRAYGTGFAGYHDAQGKLDVFAKQKAMTRAARNSRKQLISLERVVGAISNLAGIPNTLPPASQQGQETPEQERERKQKEMFAVFNDRETDLMNEYGINKFTFWGGVKVKFAIVSRAEMTTAQMQMVVTALRADEFPQWIKGLKTPNDKVKLFAICEERKKDLPDNIWDRFVAQTGVRQMNRLTMVQAKSCYDLACELLGIEKSEPESEEPLEGEMVNPEPEATKPGEGPIPF